MRLATGLLLAGCARTGEAPERAEEDPIAAAETALEIRARLPVAQNAAGVEVLYLMGLPLIEVTLDGIHLNDAEIVPLDGGWVSPESLSRGMLLEPLRKELESVLETVRVPDLDPEVVIAMDTRVPTETLYYLMFSVGQAGGAHFIFLVEDAELSPWPGWLEEPPAGRQVLAAPHADGSVGVSLARPRPRPEPRVVPQEGLGVAVEGVLAGDTMGCAIQLLDLSQPFGKTLALTDALSGLGAREITLGRQNMDPVVQVPVEAESSSADTSRRYSDTDTAAVLVTSAPAILRPRMSSSDPATQMECGPAFAEQEPQEEGQEVEEEEE